MHRVVIKTKSKHGIEAEPLTQFPLRMVAVAFDERVRLTAGKQITEVHAKLYAHERKYPSVSISITCAVAESRHVLAAPAYVERLIGGNITDQPPPFALR